MLIDTIAAIATPLGEGGLAVVRISGADAIATGDRVFEPLGKSSCKLSAAETHTLQYGRIVRQGQFVDEVLIAVMRSPRTYTREDVVEISCHGGLLPAKMVLDTVLENGARLALPGEFTRRAFLNGRLDLAQAEAVADVIHARTELALEAAQEQLAGKLSQRINKLRDDLMHILAHIEAHIDFPDEDIAPETRDRMLQRMEEGVTFIDELLRTAKEGQLLRRGVRAAIIGRPNAGKSSLLNQLLGHNRAIVSTIPGTTRDTIEETANIRGLPVVFVDTAGLRDQSGDEIEVEGMRRSRESLQRAEFILHVLDASEPLTEEDKVFLREFSNKKRIIVRNKVDLPVRLDLSGADLSQSTPVLSVPLSPQRGEGAGVRGKANQERSIPSTGAGEKNPEQLSNSTRIVDICCLSGQGIDALKDTIKELLWSGEIKAEMLQVMINSRHQDALRRARESTLRTIEAMRADQTLELVALDLRIAVNAVGEVVGKTTTEDLLDSIFSQFCIGK